MVRVEVINRSASPVTIVLTTGPLAPNQPSTQGNEQPSNTAATSSTSPALDNLVKRMGLTIGVTSGQTRFFGLAVGADQTQVFTVERGVYLHRTTACGTTVDGVVDISHQLRLVFVPCNETPANQGAPSMEKISLTGTLSPTGQNWDYAFK